MLESQAGSRREEHVLNTARGLYHLNCDWVTFYRELFGPEGVVRQCYPTVEEAAQFEQSEAYEEVQRMIRELRQQGREPTQEEEPLRMITVRLPKSLHESLREEAFRHQTSMNKLCISKLLQLIDADFVPSDA